MLAVIVNDILAASTSQAFVDQFDREMRSVYDLISFGQPKLTVGLNIQTIPDGLTIDQVQFVKDMTIQFKQYNCKSVSTPVAIGDVPHGVSPLLPSNNCYLSLVGSLLWVSLTRSDIEVTVSLACSRSVNPTKVNLTTVICILRYLLHTPHVKLTFSKSYTDKYVTQVFTDVVWANEIEGKSRYGYLICLYGYSIMWETKLTTMVFLSIAESEYIVAVNEAKTVLSIGFVSMCSELCDTTFPTINMLEVN